MGGAAKEDNGHFRRVLCLVHEVSPCLRGLDSSLYEELHKKLVINLGNCALNLLGKKTASSDGDLVITFCCVTLTEYLKSPIPIKDKVYKIVCRICSSLLTSQENKFSYIMDILDCVARECKVAEGNTGPAFVELVNYCVSECKTINASSCCTFAAYLRKMAEHFKQVMTAINAILRLYAAGLLLFSCNLSSRGGDLTSFRSAKFECLIETLLKNENILQSSPLLLGSWHFCCKSNDVLSGFGYECLDGHTGSQLGSDCEASMTYLSFYLEALTFLCKLLAKSVNSERKRLITEEDGASAFTMLSTVIEAFHILCRLILSSPSFSSEESRDGFEEKSNTVLGVALAAFTLSIKTSLKLQESKKLIKQIIAGKWIKIKGLQYIIDSLYNIAVFFLKKKQLKEASKVLNLSCKATWLCIQCLCGNLSEGALKEFVMMAYSRNALLLRILYDANSPKIEMKMIEILKNWSTSNDLFGRLPAPIPIVKQWVEIECKRVKDVDETVHSLTLYRLLSSTELSKRNIGMILEQELNAYEEMSIKYPELCQKMLMKITNILLLDMYITPDCCFQKAQSLVRKGKTFRFCSLGGLPDCIQCLSEAITIMNEISLEICTDKNSIDHQLCVAHCLRAQLTQEGDPNSKKIFEDVKAALDIWLSNSYLDHFEGRERSALSDSIMILLYNLIDLMQLKGFMELSNDAYRLMIRFFKSKNVSSDKWLALLWGSRRLSHALCVSPVDKAFMLNLSDEFGEPLDMNFWIHRLQGNQPSLIGFQQNFSFLFASSHRSSHSLGSSFQTDITIDEVQKAALELVSNVPVQIHHCDPVHVHSIFLAGYLYYDLCPRLVANGQLTEALSFAKEAHKLHAKLFSRKFLLLNEDHSVVANFSKNDRDVGRIRLKKSAIREILLFDSMSWDLKDNYLSPWKIMQSYLESTLQLGIIHEMIGEGTEAENYLRHGKDIACSQQLPVFTVAFSSLLGKLYVKKRLWDLAEKELQSAELILKDSRTTFCCSRCKLILEVTLYQYLGDLCRSKFENCKGIISEENAKVWYISALDKLNLSDWKNSLSCPEDGSNGSATDVKCAACKTCTCSITTSTTERPETKIGDKHNRKTRNVAALAKESNLVVENKSRLTRSSYRSSQNQHTSLPSTSEFNEKLHGIHISDPSDMLGQKESVAMTCVFSKMGCWHCLPFEVMKSGLLNDFINFKWEFVRRKFSMMLLTRVAKCFAYPGLIDETQRVLLRSVSFLVSRNAFSHTFSSIPLDCFRHLVVKEIPGDVFAMERAEIVHDICLFSLKCYRSKLMRNIFFNLSAIRFEDMASWLMVAFVTSREIPVIFQKVSRLLAVMYVVSAMGEQFSLSSSSKALGENFWSSYFHQASIGTHLSHQFLSHQTGRCKGSSATGSSCIRDGTFNFLRLVPDTTVDLAEYVKKLFDGLPSTPIINISLLGCDYTSLLQELLPHLACVQAWMLF